MPAQPDIAVIGAGVIGVTAAFALQREGCRVTLYDRTGIAAEASRGNAGAFAFSDVEPLATPRIMRKAPRWLFDALGPLSIPPGYALQILPWMLRFWRSSWRDRYAIGVRQQAALMVESATALAALVRQTGAESLLRREGQLQLYDNATSFRASEPAWELRRRHGIRFERLDDADAIAAIQPGLAPTFRFAVHTPDWINVSDPRAWVEHLAGHVLAGDASLTIADVNALIPHSDRVELEIQPAGDATTTRVAHDQVVVAAGAWSHRLARTLGERISLETERGYNTTLPAGAFDLRTHLTFDDHGFVVTRINDGVRVGGAVELGGLERPPDYRRADAMLDKAQRFLPSLNTSGGTQWMGYRPSMPDSLPVIRRARRCERVIYAFGHGHLGLTQSAGTAERVAALCLA